MNLDSGQLHEGNCSALVQFGYARLTGTLVFLIRRAAWNVFLYLKAGIGVLVRQVLPQASNCR